MGLTGEAKLVVEGGPRNGETFPVRGPTTTLGRQRSNEVYIHDALVARRPAEILQTEAGYYLRDMGSINGTFLNEIRIPPGDQLVLADGDIIRLGGTSLGFPPDDNQRWRRAGEQYHGGPRPPATAAGFDPAWADDGLYEGTLRLRVDAGGSMGPTLRFVQRLRESPDCRVLRMANNDGGGMDMWLALREPTHLRQLLGVDGVDHISPTRGPTLYPGSDEEPITVVLNST